MSTINISFDPNKNAENVQIRGLSFDLAINFEWSQAFIEEDLRCDYGERRYRALGFIDERRYVVIFTPRPPKVHIISLRKANQREIKRYEKHTQS